jgi:hypothetical protein
MTKRRRLETDHPHSFYQCDRAWHSKRGELEAQEKMGGELHNVDAYRKTADEHEANKNGDLLPEERDYL